jgi:hypothetical protein
MEYLTFFYRLDTLLPFTIVVLGPSDTLNFSIGNYIKNEKNFIKNDAP